LNVSVYTTLSTQWLVFCLSQNTILIV